MAVTLDSTPETRRRPSDEEPAPQNGASRTADETWQLMANVSIIGMFALAILAALYLMKDVAVPVILAWVVANILLPVVARMEKAGIPRDSH